MKLWYQSSVGLAGTVHDRDALLGHFAKGKMPDTEVVLHGRDSPAMRCG